MEILMQNFECIGHKYYQNEKGNTNLLCCADETWYKERYIINILKLENYRILAKNPIRQGNKITDIEYVTNLPWWHYLEL